MLPRANPAAICERVAEGAVLLQRDSEIYFGLNAVALRVWELLPESRDLDELCAVLGGEYPGVPLEEIRGDVEDLLEELAANGLVIHSDELIGGGEGGVDEDLALPAP